MKRWLLPAVIAALSLFLVCGRSALCQKNGDATDVKDFMRAKLVHMQKVLEGITTEDYDLIRKNANELTLLSHATQWRVLQTETYQQHSAEFRRATGALVEAAKKKNLDGTAFAYVDTTMKCVTCHKYVRSVRMASLEPPVDLRSLFDGPRLARQD